MKAFDQTRRLFLGRAALTVAAASTAAAVASIPSAAATPAKFTHPDEYIAAMTAIGWRAVAGFHFMRNGSVHPMGVYEYGPAEQSKSWNEFKKVRARVPASKVWSDVLWSRLWALGATENLLPHIPGPRAV